MAKRTNSDLQNFTQKTKDRATQTHTKNQGWTRIFSKGKPFGSTCDFRRLSLVINSMMKNVSHECGNNRIVTNEKHRYSVTINQIMMATVKLRWTHLHDIILPRTQMHVDNLFFGQYFFFFFSENIIMPFIYSLKTFYMLFPLINCATLWRTHTKYCISELCWLFSY